MVEMEEVADLSLKPFAQSRTPLAESNPADQSQKARSCPLNVLVVDDHPVFAEALQMAINVSPGLSCTSRAADVDTAVALSAEAMPDVAVMDVNLKGMDGIAGTRVLLEQHPDMRVLVLTGERVDTALLAAALEAGASALLSKASSLSTLVGSITALRPENFVLDRSCLTTLLSPAGSGAPDRGSAGGTLTEREQQILAMLAAGTDPQAAASQLGIKVSTCRGYIKSLYSKLGAHSQLEAVAIARTRRLLD